MAGQTRINGNLIDTGTDPEDIVSISAGDARYPKLDGPNTLSGDLTVDNGTLFVDSANNRVGVGTSSPQERLDVDGSIVVPSSSFYKFGNGDVRLFGTSSSNIMSFVTSGSEAARIDSSGRFLLGDSSVADGVLKSPKSLYAAANLASSSEAVAVIANLNGSPAGDTILEIATPNDLNFAWGDQNAIAFTRRDGLIFGSVATNGNDIKLQSSRTLMFDTNGSEAARIDSNGNLLVGTTVSPSENGSIVSETGFFTPEIRSVKTRMIYESARFTSTTGSEFIELNVGTDFSGSLNVYAKNAGTGGDRTIMRGYMVTGIGTDGFSADLVSETTGRVDSATPTFSLSVPTSGVLRLTNTRSGQAALDYFMYFNGIG